MYILAYSLKRPDGSVVDEWLMEERKSDARETYRRLLNRPDLYSASLCAVVESTDYDPAPSL